MPGKSTARPPARSAGRPPSTRAFLVQRRCTGCEEEGEEKKKKEEEEKVASLLRKEAPGEAATDEPTPGAGARSLAERLSSILALTGQPIESSVRVPYEQRFGRSFEDVRVHTGSEADASAREVHALAYTADCHVVFRAGQYAPDTWSGRRLLAHELAHVVQGDGAADPPRSPEVAPPDGALEQAASRAAEAVVGDSPAEAGGAGALALRPPAGGVAPGGGEGTPLPQGEAPHETAPRARTAGPRVQRFALDVAAQPALFSDGVPAPGQVGREPFMKDLRQAVTAAANTELADVGRTADDCPYIHTWFSYYAGRDAAHVDKAIQRYARPGERSIASYQDAVVSRVRAAVRIWKTTGQVTGIPAEAPARAAIAALAPSTQGEAATLQAKLGAGRDLDAGVRSRLEGAFGQDLADVRVHTDGRAAAMAQGIAARAFTVGRDIAFGPGQYHPGTPFGDALIAHEVAHTIQQGGEARAGNTLSEQSDTALDAEADAAAAGAVGSHFGLPSAAPPTARGGLRLQKCGDSAPAYVPYGPSAFREDLQRYRSCGLLDAPFRPPNVAPFPDYPESDDLWHKEPPSDSCGGGDTGYYPPEETLASVGTPGAAGVLGQAQWWGPMVRPGVAPRVAPRFVPRGPMPRPAPRPMPARPMPARPMPARPMPARPAPAPKPAPAPQPGAPRLYPPVPPIVPLPEGETIDPDTGRPVRPDDQEYMRRLTEPQKEYYRWLRDADNIAEPETEADLNPDEDTAPEPTPEQRRRRPGCVERDVPRRGGHALHDAYATQKSGSTSDYYAWGPRSGAINYDGRTPPVTVWEVKVGGGWLFNCDPKWKRLAQLKLATWDQQKNRGMAIAGECGYTHIWACQNPWVMQLLNQRWLGNPPVVT